MRSAQESTLVGFLQWSPIKSELAPSLAWQRDARLGATAPLRQQGLDVASLIYLLRSPLY
jgi:hypothetical protein